MTIDIRKDGALIDGFKPEYYWCGGGCCTGDTPTPPGPEPPTPDTGITSIHIIVADTITDSGRASAVFTPSTADTSLYYSSSDDSIAEIDPDTGEITVIQTGVVTFCVEDLYTGLEDCKEVNVIKSEPEPPVTGITAITIVVDNVITDFGIATSVFQPATAETQLVYTSADESVAVIDPETGEIEVIRTGSVTFCVEDLLTHLSDCKTVSVIKSEDPDTGSPFPICVIDTGTTGNPISLKIIYNVKSVERETILYTHNDLYPNNIALIEFSDGTSIVPPGGYGGLGHIFNETGDTTVIFTMTSNHMYRNLFANVPDIVNVEIYNGFYDGDYANGGSVFSGCTSLSSITFTSENLWVTPYFCEGCVSLKNITFNSCLYEISSYAFRGCTSLQTLVLPPNIISLNDGAFSGCTSLTSITSYGSTTSPSGVPALANGVFTGVASNGVLHYPSGLDYSFWFRSLPSGWVGEPF